MTKLSLNWPKLAFIYFPLLLITVDAAVLVNEHMQPDAQKAIRLVKESKSRKEIFTVQQYLYTTIYYRKNQGEPIEIGGWKVDEHAGQSSGFTVEFSYSDSIGQHLAAWDVDLERKRVIPKNDDASHLSWH